MKTNFLILALIAIIFLYSCKTSKEFSEKTETTFNFADEINNSIIDGFFDGDITNAPKNTYFLKNKNKCNDDLTKSEL